VQDIPLKVESYSDIKNTACFPYRTRSFITLTTKARQQILS